MREMYGSNEIVRNAVCCCRIIKSMYQRLSYLRNPRFAAQAAAPAALPLKGSSAAHRRHCGPQASSSTTTVQPRQYGSRAVLTGAEAGFGVCPAQVIQWWGGQSAATWHLHMVAAL
jgi:hypothetical protein